MGTVCLKDVLRLTYNWIKGKIQKERDNGIINEYARSQVVETSEPKDICFVYTVPSEN